MNKDIAAAEILVSYSSLNESSALSTSEISINEIDWEKIENTEMSKHEYVLIEILRFILLNKTSVYVQDLLTLNDVDLSAVLLALNTKFQKEL